MKKRYYLIAILLNCILGSFSQGLTQLVTPIIPNLFNSHSVWVDLDNDGDKDLIKLGEDNLGNKNTKIYLNDGSGSFTVLIHNMPQLSSGRISVSDYNLDGFVDILLFGAKLDGANDVPSFSVHKNNGDNTFTEVFNGDVVSFYDGDVVWDDLDGDFISEIVICGKDVSDNVITKCYKLTSGSYNEVVTSVVAMNRGGLIATDLNGDGLKELVISGITTSLNNDSKIYKNNGNLQFEQLTVSELSRITEGNISYADIDNDGDNDIFLTGKDENSNRTSELFINNGNFSFTIHTGFEQLKNSFSKFLDINSDGFVDLILCGNNGTEEKTILYINNKNNTFTASSHSFENIEKGHISVADIDGDRRNDILESGLNSPEVFTVIYKNTITSADNEPGSPLNLSSDVKFQNVTLTWDAPAASDETASSAFTYNLYVRNNSGNYLIRPLTDVTPSQKRTFYSTDGNMGTQKTVSLSNLTEGRYFWSVQTVDATLNVSTFSAEQSFVACEDFHIADDIKICMNQTKTFTINPKYTVNRWYTQKHQTTLDSDNSIDFKVVETDNLIADFSITSLGCNQTDTIVVDTLTLPEFSFGADIDVCYNSIKKLEVDAKNVTNYEWSSAIEGVLPNTTSDYDLKVLRDETITATVTNQKGCIYTDNISITSLVLPEFSLGADKDICKFNSVSLEPDNTYASTSWFNLNNNQLLAGSHQYTPKIVSDSTIIAEATSSNNCVFRDTITINMLELPNYFLGADTTICYNDTLELKVANSFSNVKWYNKSDNLLLHNGFTYLTRVLSVLSIYSIVEDNKGCIKNDTIEVNKYDLPVYSLGEDISVCYGSERILVTNNYYDSLRWYNNHLILEPNNDSLTINIHQDTTIYTEAVDGNLCHYYDTINIKKWELPAVNLGNDLHYCHYDTAKISPSTFDTYQWRSTGNMISDEESNIYKQVVLEKDTVTLLASDHNNCFNSDTIVINRVDLPIINIGSDTSICKNELITLSVPDTLKSVTWKSDNYGDSENVFSITNKVQYSDTFITNVESNFGCKFSDTLNLTMKPLPEFSLADTSKVCYGEKLKIETGLIEKKEVIWRFESDPKQYSVESFEIIVYKSDTLVAKVTGNNECLFSDTTFVKMNSLPVPFAGNDVTICYGDTVNIGSDALYGDIVWSEGVEGKQPEVSPLQTTNFNLKVTDDNGCKGYDTVEVTVNPPTLINLKEEAEVCDGQSIAPGSESMALGSLFDYNYRWFPQYNVTNPDSLGASFLVDSTLVYGVEIQTFKCKPDTAYIKLVKLELPVIETEDTVIVGTGQQAQLTASGGVEYLWSPSEYLNFNDVSDPMVKSDFDVNFTLQVTDEYGCESSQSVLVKMKNQLFIPNLFTPNDDGLNDKFLIYGFGIEELNITVYNTVGKVVYESSDVTDITTNGWDGYDSGSEASEGLYYWKVNGFFKNGERIRYLGKSTGVVNLLR